MVPGCRRSEGVVLLLVVLRGCDVIMVFSSLSLDVQRTFVVCSFVATLPGNKMNVATLRRSSFVVVTFLVLRVVCCACAVRRDIVVTHCICTVLEKY